MQAFLQRFSGIVLGMLSGFDRLVFRGRLRRLYCAEAMNHYCNANRVLRKEFKEHARSVTKRVMDWSRAQQLFDQQLQTSWPTVLDELQRTVHPLHPGHLGKFPVAYNWTVFQSEWATDVAFHSRRDLEALYAPWVRHAFLNFDSAKILRFLGRSGRLLGNGPPVHSNVEQYDGARVKHWLERNSIKMYNHVNVLRSETTINNPYGFRVYRTSENDPDGAVSLMLLRHGVVDLPCRAEVSQAANERYLEALAGTAETKTVKELAAPLCRRATEPAKTSPRKVRALNPMAADDMALLRAISDPKWMVNGLRNRDLVPMLYPTASDDPTEQRRRSARVTRLLRLLRGHGLLEKVPHTHRYQVTAQARTTILALLAASDANPSKLMSEAA
jgi:hypothetical protein